VQVSPCKYLSRVIPVPIDFSCVIGSEQGGFAPDQRKVRDRVPDIRDRYTAGYYLSPLKVISPCAESTWSIMNESDARAKRVWLPYSGSHTRVDGSPLRCASS
jgi:hypothetical protein